MKAWVIGIIILFVIIVLALVGFFIWFLIFRETEEENEQEEREIITTPPPGTILTQLPDGNYQVRAPITSGVPETSFIEPLINVRGLPTIDLIGATATRYSTGYLDITIPSDTVINLSQDTYIGVIYDPLTREVSYTIHVDNVTEISFLTY